MLRASVALNAVVFVLLVVARLPYPAVISRLKRRLFESLQKTKNKAGSRQNDRRKSTHSRPSTRRERYGSFQTGTAFRAAVAAGESAAIPVIRTSRNSADPE
jgi:hypothetical protein